MDVPLIEQIKIQAQVLVPLVRALRAELGEERANSIVRKALSEVYRKFGEKWWRAQGPRNPEEKMTAAFGMFAAGDAIDYEVVNKTPQAFDVDVVGCRYAKFYKELGEPELGFLLLCSADFPILPRPDCCRLECHQRRSNPNDVLANKTRAFSCFTVDS